jgi:hypothetical protein
MMLSKIILTCLAFGCFCVVVILGSHRSGGDTAPAASVDRRAVKTRPPNSGKDQAAAVIGSCGNPTRETDEASPQMGPHGRTMKLIYRKENIELRFGKDPANPLWTLTGAFHLNGDDDLDGDEIHQSLPCTVGVLDGPMDYFEAAQ